MALAREKIRVKLIHGTEERIYEVELKHPHQIFVDAGGCRYTRDPVNGRNWEWTPHRRLRFGIWPVSEDYKVEVWHSRCPVPPDLRDWRNNWRRPMTAYQLADMEAEVDEEARSMALAGVEDTSSVFDGLRAGITWGGIFIGISAAIGLSLIISGLVVRYS